MRFSPRPRMAPAAPAGASPKLSTVLLGEPAASLSDRLWEVLQASGIDLSPLGGPADFTAYVRGFDPLLWLELNGLSAHEFAALMHKLRAMQLHGADRERRAERLMRLWLYYRPGLALIALVAAAMCFESYVEWIYDAFLAGQWRSLLLGLGAGALTVAAIYAGATGKDRESRRAARRIR